ncbi:MAG: tetratricopeptide repeat protein [Paludibacteraceae bacterium]
MTRLIISILAFVIATSITAQKPADASALFDEGRFAEAADINRQLLKKKPKDAVLNVRLARCLAAMSNYSEAIDYYRIAADNGYSKANLYLGDLYFDLYFFAEAADAYARWLDEGKPTPQETLHATERQRQATLGAQLLHRIEDITLIDSTITTKTNFFAKIAIPREMGTFFASNTDYVGFESGRQDRRYLTLRNNGQTDLYQTYKLMGEWTTPTPLSPILNSDHDENFPFVAADGITIYFGSKGHDGLGGYDIFTSRYNSDTDNYLPPQNVGFPFNSTGNDYMMAFDELNGIGWFVTDRFRTDDSVVIYRFVPNATRLILRNKTDDELRTAALLKTYRTAEAPQKIILSNDTRRPTQAEQFMVNDTTIYYSENDFKSDDARKKFVTLCALQMQLAQKRFTLQAKRELWAITESDDERTRLANDILTLEKNVIITEQQIRRYEQEIRLFENATLNTEN